MLGQDSSILCTNMILQTLFVEMMVSMRNATWVMKQAFLLWWGKGQMCTAIIICRVKCGVNSNRICCQQVKNLSSLSWFHVDRNNFSQTYQQEFLHQCSSVQLRCDSCVMREGVMKNTHSLAVSFLLYHPHLVSHSLSHYPKISLSLCLSVFQDRSVGLPSLFCSLFRPPSPLHALLHVM